MWPLASNSPSPGTKAVSSAVLMPKVFQKLVQDHDVKIINKIKPTLFMYSLRLVESAWNHGLLESHHDAKPSYIRNVSQ